MRPSVRKFLHQSLSTTPAGSISRNFFLEPSYLESIRIWAYSQGGTPNINDWAIAEFYQGGSLYVLDSQDKTGNLLAAAYADKFLGQNEGTGVIQHVGIEVDGSSPLMISLRTGGGGCTAVYSNFLITYLVG